MRKVWLCIFYALCIFTIVFSLFWMALPSLPFPADSGEETPASEPGLAAQGSAGQSGTDFYLCDEGGRVVVYTCSDNGLPDKRLLRTGIYVNLLPEADALRLNPISVGMMVRISIAAVFCMLIAQNATVLWTALWQALGLDVFAGDAYVRPNGTAGLTLSAVSAAVIAPVCEELLFRGAVLGAWERRGRRRAKF